MYAIDRRHKEESLSMYSLNSLRQMGAYLNMTLGGDVQRMEHAGLFPRPPSLSWLSSKGQSLSSLISSPLVSGMYIGHLYNPNYLYREFDWWGKVGMRNEKWEIVQSPEIYERSCWRYLISYSLTHFLTTQPLCDFQLFSFRTKIRSDHTLVTSLGFVWW